MLRGRPPGGGGWPGEFAAVWSAGVRSVADIFQEVDEEVRREQLKRLWDRYGTLLIAACVLIVAGVGAWRGYEWWAARKAGQVGIQYEQALTLSEAGKHSEAEAAFAKIAADGTTGFRSLARLRAAAELVPTDHAAAIKSYDAVAADQSISQVLRDVAAIRAGMLLVDTAPYAEMRQRLEPLTASDRTFRHSARELLALSAWRVGDLADARKWADMLMTDLSTPAGIRTRAEILSELIAAATGKG